MPIAMFESREYVCRLLLDGLNSGMQIMEF
jgi:hypothetical protein